MTSSGQLHKATTPTGQYCVVKVQKEEAIEEFEVQSAVMRMLATVFDFVAAFETKNFLRIVDDFLQQRASELSLSVAATNARKMAALAEGDDLETNVRIFQQLYPPEGNVLGIDRRDFGRKYRECN